MFRTGLLIRLAIPVLVVTTCGTIMAEEPANTPPPARSISEWHSKPATAPAAAATLLPARSIIEHCISNRKSRRPVVSRFHETPWNPGGIGNTTAASGSASSRRKFAVDCGADGRCGGQRRVAVARNGPAKRRQGLGRSAGTRTSAQAHAPAAPAFAETARSRRTGLRVP